MGRAREKRGEEGKGMEEGEMDNGVGKKGLGRGEAEKDWVAQTAAIIAGFSYSI